MESRHAHALRICRRVSEVVAMRAPRGIGHWDPAWQHVEAPSKAFLNALDDWVRTGSPDAQREVQTAAERVADAWTEAARRWEAAGRPGTREVAHAP